MLRNRAWQQAFERLEGKLSRAVLRGREVSNGLLLPDQQVGGFYATLPPSSTQLINSSGSGGASCALSGAVALSLSALRLCSQRKKLYFVLFVRRKGDRAGGELLAFFIVSLYGSLWTAVNQLNGRSQTARAT
jgi:hypothetical protein